MKEKNNETCHIDVKMTQTAVFSIIKGYQIKTALNTHKNPVLLVLKKINNEIDSLLTNLNIKEEDLNKRYNITDKNFMNIKINDNFTDEELDSIINEYLLQNNLIEFLEQGHILTCEVLFNLELKKYLVETK